MRPISSAGIGLVIDPAGRAVPALLLGHRDRRPREVVSGPEAQPHGQLRLFQIRRPTHKQLCFSRARCPHDLGSAANTF
jgi:hypothetical protein